MLRLIDKGIERYANKVVTCVNKGLSLWIENSSATMIVMEAWPA